MARQAPPPSLRSGHLQELDTHFDGIRAQHLRDLFAGDPQRGTRYRVELGDLRVDYSKHRFTAQTLDLLFKYAHALGLRQRIAGLLNGSEMNPSEGRPVLHTALRTPAGTRIISNGEDVVPLVQRELEKLFTFSRNLNNARLKGATGERIDTLIHIGIGGSDLGPRLAVDALYEHCVSDIRIEFVSNIDDQDLFRVLQRCNPRTTFLSIASKSFTTLETRENAMSALHWLVDQGCKDPTRQIVAITARPDAAKALGIPDDRIFRIWDWVGGRYSIWSSMALPLAVAIGPDGFRELLAGGRAVDEHFAEKEFESNLPVILGLLDVWYADWFGAETCAVVPYDLRLRLLPEYLGQLIMESNGKRVTRDGTGSVTRTAPVVWGSVGTNAQHAFFQLLHQGTHLVPVDLLAGLTASYNPGHHRHLLANCLAQGEALMAGRQDSREPHRVCPGNQPSSTFLYENMTPRMLGMLLALYEHRTFVQAVLWDINAFDQWGVELGKEFAAGIERELAGEPGQSHDSSTAALLALCRRRGRP